MNPRRLERLALQRCFEAYAEKMGLYLMDMHSCSSDDPDFWICKAEYYIDDPSPYLTGDWIAFKMTPSAWLHDKAVFPQWVVFAQRKSIINARHVVDDLEEENILEYMREFFIRSEQVSQRGDNLDVTCLLIVYSYLVFASVLDGGRLDKCLVSVLQELYSNVPPYFNLTVM
jgi:hypothetical protein